MFPLFLMKQDTRLSEHDATTEPSSGDTDLPQGFSNKFRNESFIAVYL